ncbi:MAG: class II aldolase/adducin family protein [Anaerolineae bacterium]|nr:class II aldolase/adducin family protein [Anaerolineae bacterium]
MSTSPADAREAIVEVARLIYARQLSDSAGGNVSVRVGGRIYITPRYMGSRYRWSITPDLITVLDAGSHQVLAGPGDISRESKAHLALYRAFPEAGAVIHAHPFHVQVFACANRPLPAVAEYTRKFGTVPCIPPARAHSQDLAEAVVASLSARRAEFESHGLAVLLPYHGIIVMGHDLDEAYDVLERMEVNARCTLLGALLRTTEEQA